MALYLHGSRALGSHREDSDYDYAYLAPHGAPVEPVEDRLLPLLAEHHATDEREIDLQNLRQAPPYFRVRVFEHGQLLYCGDSTELARFQNQLSEPELGPRDLFTPLSGGHAAKDSRGTVCLLTFASSRTPFPRWRRNFDRRLLFGARDSANPSCRLSRLCPADRRLSRPPSYRRARAALSSSSEGRASCSTSSPSLSSTKFGQSLTAKLRPRGRPFPSSIFK